MTSNAVLLMSTLCANFDTLQSKVKLFPFALSESENQCFVYSDAKNTQDGHILCGVDRAEADRHFGAMRWDMLYREMISAVRLDDALTQAEIDSIGMVKIDTEGFEYHVLKGGKKVLLKIPYLRSEFVRSYISDKGAPEDADAFLMEFHNAGYNVSIHPFVDPMPVDRFGEVGAKGNREVYLWKES